MKKLLIITLVLLTQLQVLACTCIGSSTVKSALKQTDAVFLGRVVSREVFPVKDEGVGLVIKMARYSVEVRGVYKGRKVFNKVEVITGLGNGDCGFQFQVGQEYVIYANYRTRYPTTIGKVPAFLSTDDCTRTREKELGEIEELKKYRKEKHPKPVQ